MLEAYTGELQYEAGPARKVKTLCEKITKRKQKKTKNGLGW
jgi:hypothetical protein